MGNHFKKPEDQLKNSAGRQINDDNDNHATSSAIHFSPLEEHSSNLDLSNLSCNLTDSGSRNQSACNGQIYNESDQQCDATVVQKGNLDTQKHDATAAPLDAIPNPVLMTESSAPMYQQNEIADVDAALKNPDFTSVFAPLSMEETPGESARRNGAEPVISMRHVTKIYPAQPNKPALEDICLDIYPGEFVFLVGHSGSGKSTLLRTMTRDVRPTNGSVIVAGQDLTTLRNRKVPYLRRQMGVVFQDFKLLPNKTAFENVAFALECIGKPKAVIRSQVPEVLRLVGLAEKMDAMPDQLSGGEQQRVSVARAMVNRPPLLICDEPTGNLDPAISLGIMKLLERINRTGTTVVVATHDREMVDSMRRRVIALEAGHVVRDQERGGYGNYGTF